MFVELQNPEKLSNEELDIHLANGWFRMGQSIFTTNFLKFNDITYSSIWLRIDLLKFKTSNFQQKLLKTNARFDVKIQPAQITQEQENLFYKYKNHVTFDAAPSVQSLLFGQKQANIYDSYEVNIYDNSRLIAVGIFDLGENSAAGITCFYDPDYKKHSLGKYLMYLKIAFCKEKGLKFFYPGYFAPGYSLFDYKLDLAKPALQYLDVVSDKWFDFEKYSSQNIPFNVMSQKLSELRYFLDFRNIKNVLKLYDFFDADMSSNLNGLGLFDYPVFLFCPNLEDSLFKPLIIFDIREKQYHLVLCSRAYESIFDECKEGHYNEYLLQIIKYLYTGDSADEMAEVIEMCLLQMKNVE